MYIAFIYDVHVGRIVITYQAVSSSLSGTLATPGEDFDNSTMTVIMEENEASATIVVPILDVSLSV